MKGLPVSEMLLFFCVTIASSCHIALAPHVSNCLQNEGKVTIGTNYRPSYASGTHLQFKYRNTHLKAEGNLEQIGRSTMPMQGIIALKKGKLSSENGCQRLSNLSLDRAKFTAKGLQSGMKSKRSLLDYKKHTSFTKRALQDLRTLQRCPQHNFMKTETPCRTHIFLSAAHMITDHHTHLRVAQVWDVLPVCSSRKSSAHNMFHRPLLDVLDPFPSFFFHTTSDNTDFTAYDWNQEIPCAIPHGGKGVGGRA